MKILVYITSFVLFFVPFFWFQPGEMDLGGDNSRLYFYDAAEYIKNHTFYGISPSNLGYENISYFGLSFIALLALLQKFITSPTLLISTFHGLSLSLGFLGCYISLKEILSNYKGVKGSACDIAAIAAGLFYTLSQVNIQGWDKIILTHDQFFLNPICFYLLLKYVITKKIAYLLAVLLLTFIFSHNFGYASAPPFFAFYPLSVLYILIYAKYIKRTQIPVKGLLMGLCLFLLLQAFHIAPQLYNLLSADSGTYNALFSSEAKFDRGLGYFSGIAESVRVSKSIFALPQLMETQPLQLGFLILPFIVIAGFYYNKKNKLYLLTGVFFLMLLFFVSANITALGLSLYKSLFSIPGFAMFRNFYGQWAYAFQFFYALMLGQALVILLASHKQNKGIMLLPIFFILYLIIVAMPFIDGSLVNKVLWQSRNVKLAMTMDSQLQEAISFTRKLPEGKVLTLPISDVGYQMVAGQNGGVYQGPSLVAYLAGKKDFSGLNEFGPFSGLIQKYIAEKNYNGLRNILVLLDIKYIFYNSDVRIYDEQFPDFPYSDVRRKLGFPYTQNDYKAFLSLFGAKEIFHIGPYYVYKISDADYSVYSPTRVIPTSSAIQTWDFYLNNNSVRDNKLAIVPEDVVASTKSALFLKVESITTQDMMYADFPIPVLYPFVRWEPNSPIYFALAMREKRNIDKLKSDPKLYVAAQMSQGAKRISELQKWGNTMDTNIRLNNSSELFSYWKDPDVAQILSYGKYNSWEVSLSRYFQSMHAAAVALKAIDDNSLDAERLRRSYVYQLENNRKRLNVIISSLYRSDDDKSKLYTLVDKSFNKLQKTNLIKDHSIGFWYYILGDNAKGNAYNFYIHKSHNFDPKNSMIAISSTALLPDNNEDASEILYLPEVAISQNLFAHLRTEKSPTSLQMNWQPAKDIFPIKKGVVQKGEMLQIDNKLHNALINKIYDLEDGKHVVTFEYNSNGKPFEANIFLKARHKATDRTEPAYLGIFRESISARDWQKFTAVIDSFQTQTLLLGIKSLNENSNAIKIRNFTIYKLDDAPVLSVKAVDGKIPELAAPKLSVEKINPTKYEVQVTKAPASYMLVLSDAYSKNWKIIEESSGKKIAENAHFVANGYANGWMIDNVSTNKSSYKLIIKLQSQNIFYISLLISGITAFSVFIAFIYTLTYGKK
jgi:hypothetical protein